MKFELQEGGMRERAEINAVVRAAKKVKANYREQIAVTTLPDGRRMVTTCQICGGAVRANEGLIANHGYQREVQPDGRKYGKFGPPCRGSGHPPYEYDREALLDFIEELRDKATAARGPLKRSLSELATIHRTRLEEPLTMTDADMAALVHRSDIVRTAATAKAWNKRKKGK